MRTSTASPTPTARRRLLALCVLGVALATGAGSCQRSSVDVRADDPAFDEAQVAARLANEGFGRALRYVDAWLTYVDPTTHLFPESLLDPSLQAMWNPANNAADNYAFMVMTTALLDRSRYNGIMMDILYAERKLTSRVDRMPDYYDFGRQEFENPGIDTNRVLFRASEYAKDGCLPLTELLGKTPWHNRMMGMIDDIWRNANRRTAEGVLPTSSGEVHGEQLQLLSRLYWMTGDQTYLDYALRLGDHYLTSGRLPTRQHTRMRLLDHGCEIVAGLCELYITLHFADPERKAGYTEPLYEMLDRILEIGRNEHGLFYQTIEPVAGQHSDLVADTSAYLLYGYYGVYLVDGVERYRDAVILALASLDEHYRSYKWEDYAGGGPIPPTGGQDGYADAIEGALTLHHREPDASVARWIDSQAQVLWSYQQDDGLVEGWYADGNFARTTLLYSLWKTGGTTMRPWRKDLVFGASYDSTTLKLTLTSEEAWEGTLRFDTPRHRTVLNLPLNWPRINEFPEWFPVNPGEPYEVHDVTRGTTTTVGGEELVAGLPLKLEPGESRRLVVAARRPPSR